MVFVGQLMVALCFCELAARYPVAGSVYNWSKQLGGPHVGWLGGWMMMTATMVSLAAVALAYQITLPQISSWFQFIGDGSGKYRRGGQRRRCWARSSSSSPPWSTPSA